VAVGAAHVALVDLGLDRRPGKSTAEHGRHVICLLAPVVELQNDRIRLAAVDARMLAEELPSAILILSCRPSMVHADLSNLMIAIPQIPIVLVARHACTTPRLSLAGFSALDAELFRRLAKATARAGALAIHDIRGHLLAELKEAALAVVNAKFARCLPRVAAQRTSHLAISRSMVAQGHPLATK
jgi:hypothetical protein